MAKINDTKDKQLSTKHTHTTKDRTSLKPEGELRCPERVNSSGSNSDTRRVNLVTNPVKSHERGKHQEVFTTSGTYPLSFVDVDKRFISCIDLD
jgi:hypothetical protein